MTRSTSAARPDGITRDGASGRAIPTSPVPRLSCRHTNHAGPWRQRRRGARRRERTHAGAERGAPHTRHGRRDAGPALRRRARVPLHGRALRGPHQGDPRRPRALGSAHTGLRQSRAVFDGRPQRRAAPRARRLPRSDGRAHVLPRGLHRPRRRAPAQGRRRMGGGPADAVRDRQVVAARRAGAADVARDGRLGALGGGDEGRRRARARHRCLRRPLAPVDRRAPRRLG